MINLESMPIKSDKRSQNEHRIIKKYNKFFFYKLEIFVSFEKKLLRKLAELNYANNININNNSNNNNNNNKATPSQK